VSIFTRVFLSFWAAAITIAVLTALAFATFSPFRTYRSQPIPISKLKTCAEDALAAHQNGERNAPLQDAGNCYNGVLFSPDGVPLNGYLTNTSERNKKIAANLFHLVREAAASSDMAVSLSPTKALVALPVGTSPSENYVYVVMLPVPEGTLTSLVLRDVSRLILISAIFCYLLTLYFVHPITALSHTAESFGSGDLKARVTRSTVKRKDEFGELGRTFNQMADRIETLIAYHKTFLAQASHELGSPLTRLNIALALAKRTAGPVLEPELNRIGREADNLNGLVQELLLLARLESGNELALEAFTFNIASVVDEACTDATFVANSQSKSVLTSSYKDFALVGHPALLQRALDNILRNALRFARTQVLVTVSSVKRNGIMTGIITINDDGDGITTGREEAIFEPFVTFGSQFGDEGCGSGLGLAIARQAILANQGLISAQNAPNGGLIVTIELPCNIE
jgi:two-component system sensor histidine kinase CpxA